MTNSMHYQVAIYCYTKPNDKQDYEDKINLLVNFCFQHGYKISRNYVDDDTSNRAGLNQLLEDIKANNITLVISNDFSVLAKKEVTETMFLQGIINYYSYIAVASI